MKKRLIKIFTLLTIIWIFWVLFRFTSETFAQKNVIDLSSIINTWCIEFTTSDGTVRKCDDVEIYYADHIYPVKKWQKTWGMSDFTDQEINVSIWEYILYKIDFVNLWDEIIRNAQVKDYLPNCVDFITWSIHGVTGATFDSSRSYTRVLFKNFKLDPGQSWYMLITGQINGSGSCINTMSYLNTWSFKSIRPNWTELFSTVIASRDGWSTSSKVSFTKDWNKSQMYPGETWLTFTLTVINEWPNPISNIAIHDVWPDNGNCILYSWREWQNLRKDEGSYKWVYKNGWDLLQWERIILKIYANIADDPACVWSYINTWKLVYGWWELYDDYQFNVITGWPTSGDITISKTVNKHYVQHWDLIEYTIIYKNTSRTQTLYDYKIVDTWPSELIFSGSDPSPDSINWNIITWSNLDPLLPWQQGTITIDAIVN